MRTTPAIDRMSGAVRVLIPAALVLVLPSFATLGGLGQQKSAPPSEPRVLIQNRSFEKKPPGPVDGGKTIVVPPQPPPNPPQNPPPPPPQQPPGPVLQLTFNPPQVRVGEEVRFILSSGRFDLVQRIPPLEIAFDDQTPARTIEIDSSGISHRFAQVGSYNVRVYLKNTRLQPTVSNTATVKVDPWSFTPSATHVEVGEPITLKIDNPPNDPNVRYWFHFREDPETTEWSPTPDAAYRYHSGGKFAALAGIRLIDRERLIDTSTDPQEIVVQDLPRNALLLDVAPQFAQLGQEVSFTAAFSSKFAPDDPGIAFSFTFGDESPARWQRERTVRHTYALPGDYQTQVAVGWRNERSSGYTEITRSDFRPINIAIQRPPPTTDNPTTPGDSLNGSDVPLYLVYVFAGLVVIAMALLVTSYKMRKGYVSAKPEYVAQADSGSAQTKDGRLALDFELQFTSNVTDASYRIDASPTGLIRFERITHD